MDYVEEVIKWFNESSPDIQKEFLETPREKIDTIPPYTRKKHS